MNKRELENSIRESVLTGNGVIAPYVDLNGVMRDVRHSYSDDDTIIKYSKKEHSLVSSNPSDVLYLGTPKSYGDLNTDALVRDDSEGTFPEELDWKNRGSEWMEAQKRSFLEISPDVHGYLKFKATMELPAYDLLYCTSIDPLRKKKRQEQMRKTNPSYDFMASIESPPTTFAKQLGVDLRKQIETDSTIIVLHGPVIYLDGDKTSEFIVRSREKFSDTFPITDTIPLFVKDKKYQVQQEYRFVVSTPHRQRTNHILLNISEDLRKLFSLVK